MHKTMYKMGMIVLFIIMFCQSACLDPIENNFDMSENGNKTLVINEIVASSSDNENDWIELYNASQYPLYLGDYSIADDNTEHEPFPLPDLTLEPLEFIVIQATNEGELSSSGSYYVPFKLGNDDRLTLYWGLAIIDILDWETNDAPRGYSFGRFPDGTGGAQRLTPTKEEPNKLPLPLDLIINEVLVSDPNGGNDWIELYVVGKDSVYLGDYSIVDDNVAHEPAPLPGIFLGPGEFIVIQATDIDPNDGSYYVPFGLGADDCVTLFWGTDIVDVLDWEEGDAPAGYSYGCFPDGSKEVQTLVPTPGEHNSK